MDKDEILEEINRLKEARQQQIKRLNVLQSEMSMLQTNIIKNDGVITYLGGQLKNGNSNNKV